MAIQEGYDRRVGSDPEKLLTLEEAAGFLDCPADDVEALIRTGRLSSFRLGGSLLRVRLHDVEALKFERGKSPPPRVAPQAAGSVPASSASVQEKISDFLYFNDFYLVAGLIVLTLLAVLFAI